LYLPRNGDLTERWPTKEKILRRQRLFAVFIIFIAAVAQSKPAADPIITQAKLWTVDKAHPVDQAVAVLGDRIVAGGSAADVDARRGPIPAF
jgi:hypothetical protein